MPTKKRTEPPIVIAAIEVVHIDDFGIKVQVCGARRDAASIALEKPLAAALRSAIRRQYGQRGIHPLRCEDGESFGWYLPDHVDVRGAINSLVDAAADFGKSHPGAEVSCAMSKLVLWGTQDILNALDLVTRSRKPAPQEVQ